MLLEIVSTILDVLFIVVPPWKHTLMFSGLRSRISEDTDIQNKTRKALEHAYLRAIFNAVENTTRDIAEGI